MQPTLASDAPSRIQSKDAGCITSIECAGLHYLQVTVAFLLATIKLGLV